MHEAARTADVTLGDDGPWALRDYALLADGERGALIDPRGGIAWMCAPGWDSEAVFSRLIGGSGGFLLSPVERWNVWGGYYEDGTLIRNSRWVLGDGVIECRQALAMPADPRRAVLLRRIRAVRGRARVRIHLDLRAGYGQHAMTDLRREGGAWTGSSGRLRIRLTGAEGARPAADGGLEATLTVPEGGEHDLVLEVGEQPTGELPDAHRLWQDTRHVWRQAVPRGPARTPGRAPRLRGPARTDQRGGGMVAAATTSLPGRSGVGRNYDYRFAWIRDQCYAGLAVAAHGPHPLLDRAVGFVAGRVLDDGPHLRPVYTVDGGPVPEEQSLPLLGYQARAK